MGNYNNKLKSLSYDDDTLVQASYDATWVLVIISGLFFTLGSWAFLRAVNDPPLKALFPNTTHFGCALCTIFIYIHCCRSQRCVYVWVCCIVHAGCVWVPTILGKLLSIGCGKCISSSSSSSSTWGGMIWLCIDI